jgi:hypothetical protein
MFDSLHKRTCLHHASYIGHIDCLSPASSHSMPAKGLQTTSDLGGCTGEAEDAEEVDGGSARGEVEEEVSTQR